MKSAGVAHRNLVLAPQLDDGWETVFAHLEDS